MEESAYEIRSQGKDTQAQVIGISMAWRDVFIRDKSDLMLFFFGLTVVHGLVFHAKEIRGLTFA